MHNKELISLCKSFQGTDSVQGEMQAFLHLPSAGTSAPRNPGTPSSCCLCMYTYVYTQRQTSPIPEIFLHTYTQVHLGSSSAVRDHRFHHHLINPSPMKRHLSCVQCFTIINVYQQHLVHLSLCRPAIIL